MYFRGPKIFTPGCPKSPGDFFSKRGACRGNDSVRKPVCFSEFWRQICCTKSTMMRSPAAANRRRSLRNRRNRGGRQTTNQRRARVVFEPDTKYRFSSYNEDGVLIVSRRKCAPPTAGQTIPPHQMNGLGQNQLLTIWLNRGLVVSRDVWGPTPYHFYKKNYVTVM